MAPIWVVLSGLYPALLVLRKSLPSPYVEVVTDGLTDTPLHIVVFLPSPFQRATRNSLTQN